MRLILLSAILSCTLFALGATPFEHGLFDAVSLNGTWEMAYHPHSHESNVAPEFKGVAIERAIPSYWEDRIGDFRAAGMKDDFLVNPWYEKQAHPFRGSASDTTLPDIQGCFYYRREFELKRSGAALLHFEGVRNQVHAWINGRFVGFRAGFSTPFELAIADGILRKGTNQVVLAVSNNPNLGYCDHVVGLATRALFRSTGGVNGNLEMRFPQSDLADIYVTTAGDLETFTVHVTGKDRYAYEILDGERVLAKGESAGDFTLATAGYRFWSPENPKRYELRLKTARGVYAQKFGLRRLVTAGEKFRLNGKPVYLRGVTEHCYFAKTLHLPRDLDYYRMVTAKRKELGFNFVRFHTYVPPVEYLEATDELGMLVHIESPNFVSEPEFAAIIAFARRHPSVVIYCTGNETRIDRLAETYLEDVAKLVHEGTDALFTPMSALIGAECLVMPGKDVIVDSPFRHNPERMARLARYSDFWTSYQQGAVSYSPLANDSSAPLDAMGDAYFGKPRTSHEICIDGSYVDLSLEAMYPQDSPILKAGIFSGIRRELTKRGLIDRADGYFRNSCEWMRRVRKFTFEKVRSSDRTAGYDFLGDINTHWHTFGYSVGMMDEFYRLKPGESAANVRRYNSAAVLLADLGSDFNVAAGARKHIALSVSNYGEALVGAELKVALVETESGKCVWTRQLACGDIESGKLTKLGSVEVDFPVAAEVKKYCLQTSLGSTIGNDWELYAFPSPPPMAKTDGLRLAYDLSEEELVSALEAGERVLLLGAGPFKSLPTTYRIGLAGRCEGNYATVIKSDHPAIAGMAKESFCGWQFRRLMEGGSAIQLEADIPFDPIVDIASSVKCIIRQAMLFEYQVGKGRLLVCSFKFGDEDPAARYLKDQLIRYATSAAFKPALSLTLGQLRSVLHAPLITGAADKNRAHNPHDPSSAVRSGALAQP